MAEEEKPNPTSLPIGKAELRTFVHRPICPVCQKTGTDEFLRATEGLIDAISVAERNSQKMQVWVCGICDFSIQLPPGAFPKYEHKQVMLEALFVMIPAMEKN